jgi:hypothetical protein
MGIGAVLAPRRDRDGHRAVNAANHGAMGLIAVVLGEQVG